MKELVNRAFCVISFRGISLLSHVTHRKTEKGGINSRPFVTPGSIFTTQTYHRSRGCFCWLPQSQVTAVRQWGEQRGRENGENHSAPSGRQPYVTGGHGVHNSLQRYLAISWIRCFLTPTNGLPRRNVSRSQLINGHKQLLIREVATSSRSSYKQTEKYTRTALLQINIDRVIRPNEIRN